MIVIPSLHFQRDHFDLVIDNLQLKSGLTLLVGQNGAGKSTLLQLLATARIPDEGEIVYGGKRVIEALPLIRSQIGFLPTGIELYEEMTPRKLLRYLVELKGVQDRSEVESLLREFALLPIQNKKIGLLPHGIKQRLAISQALIGSPTFLFLDEPLTYLDTLERRHVISLLNRYARNRLVIVSTHDLNEWENQADRILWLDRGRVQFYDSLREWKRSISAIEEVSLEEAYFRHRNSLF